MKPADHESYIAAAPEYARPILERLRGLFHHVCPDIEETIKWRQPHFEHAGLIGSMAAFKKYVSLGFFKGALLDDPLGILEPIGETGMAVAKFSSREEMPDDAELVPYIQAAIELNRTGVKRPRSTKPTGSQPEIPEFFRRALEGNAAARATFDGFPPSGRREYLDWINEAKREVTRDKRIAQSIEWLSEGKHRNWKYMR